MPTDNNFTEKTEHPFAAFCNLPPLMEPEVRLTKLGEEKIDGRLVLGVRAQSDKLGQVDLYFGTHTGLLLKSKKALPVASGEKPAFGEAFLSDYKDVQGSMIPMRIKGLQDGKVTVDIALLDVKFADKLDADAFAKP